MTIRFLSTTPHSLAFGGQELQTECLIESLRSANPGWDVGLLNPGDGKEDVDVYHLVGNSEFMWGTIRFLPPDAPLVVSAIHGVRADSPSRRVLKQLVARFAAMAKERTSYLNLRSLFLRANAVLALHDTGRRFIVDRYGVPGEVVHVIPNGVRSSLFSREKGGDTDVLILGSIIHRKAACEVASFARSKLGSRYRFHFAGSGVNDESEYLERFVELVNAAPNVVWHGHVEPESEAFNRLLDTCGILLQLSREETQSLSALEAIAAGKACVFLDKPHARERPFAEWPRVPSFRPPEINDAIGRAIQIRESGKARADVWTWKQVAEAVSTVYRHVA